MLKILVIDDEPQIRKFLRISLTANGYKVVEKPKPAPKALKRPEWSAPIS